MSYKVIDLSMSLYSDAPTMPMDPKFNITQHCTLETLGYNICRVTTSTHQGTHLDAPKHFFHDGQTIDCMPIGRFVAKAFKIDLRYKNPKEPIMPGDLKQYDGKIKKGANVLLETGWDEKFPKQEYFSDFPYVSVECADYFCERGINLVGMDLPTPNPTDWKVVHENLLRKSVIIVEGLANLKEIKEDEFLFIGLPLKLKDADGSPIRAIAIEGDVL